MLQISGGLKSFIASLICERLFRTTDTFQRKGNKKKLHKIFLPVEFVFKTSCS